MGQTSSTNDSKKDAPIQEQGQVSSANPPTPPQKEEHPPWLTGGKKCVDQEPPWALPIKT